MARPYTDAVRRDCSGCGRDLGDATPEEVAAAVEGRDLPDTQAECPHCTREVAA